MGTKPATVWLNGRKPDIGDIATSKQVNRSGRALHIWDACPECGTERWIKLNTKGNICVSCALRRHSVGDTNPRWNGGRRYAKNGIFISVAPDHPYYSMAHKACTGYCIAEHRLVMAEHLGRCLKSWEVVHHINRDNRDNRIENLLLLPSQTHHHTYTLLQNKVEELENRVIQLEAENVLLKSSPTGRCVD